MDLSGREGPLPWVSQLPVSQPSGCQPTTPEQEKKISTMMREELAAKHGIHIGPLVFDRNLGEAAAAKAAARRKFFVIGASNSDRLAMALERTGIQVVKTTTTNWRPAPEAVEALVDHVKNAVGVGDPEVVVFELLDNLVYLGRQPDGSTELPKRGAGGIYHVRGELTIAQRDIQLNIYNAVKPILMAAGTRPLIVITPFPRYMCSPCCPDKEHITNFSKDDYMDTMLASLSEIRNNFRTFMFTDNIRRVSLINPAPLMDDRAASEYWQDPVHPGATAFDQLAELVIKSASHLADKRKQEEEEALQRENRLGRDGAYRPRLREWGGPSCPYGRGHGNRGGRGNRGQRGRPYRGRHEY